MTQQDGPGIDTPRRASPVPTSSRRTRRRSGKLGAGMTQWKGTKTAGAPKPADGSTLVATKAQPGLERGKAMEDAESLEAKAQKLPQSRMNAGEGWSRNAKKRCAPRKLQHVRRQPRGRRQPRLQQSRLRLLQLRRQPLQPVQRKRR